MLEAGCFLVPCRTADDGPYTRRSRTSLLRGAAVTDAAGSVGMLALYTATAPIFSVAATFGRAVRQVKQTGTLGDC